MSEENEGLGTGLESLFDDTSHAPDTHGLTRMAARAQDVPGASRPAGWTAWVSGIAVVLAALVAVGVWFPQGEDVSPEVAITHADSPTPTGTPPSTEELNGGGEREPALAPPTETRELESRAVDEADLPYAVIFDVGWGADDDEDFLLAGGGDDDLSPDELFATYDEVLAQDG